jgi:hypothetical protein
MQSAYLALVDPGTDWNKFIRPSSPLWTTERNDPNGYVGRPMYNPGYPPQGGMNPWMAGGLGALGGDFLGYELGRMAGEMEQQPQSEHSMNPDTITPLSQGGYEFGMSYPANIFGEGPDFGGFGTEGMDFGGGGDFSGGGYW